MSSEIAERFAALVKTRERVASSLAEGIEYADGDKLDPERKSSLEEVLQIGRLIKDFHENRGELEEQLEAIDRELPTLFGKWTSMISELGQLVADGYIPRDIYEQLEGEYLQAMVLAENIPVLSQVLLQTEEAEEVDEEIDDYIELPASPESQDSADLVMNILATLYHPHLLQKQSLLEP